MKRIELTGTFLDMSEYQADLIEDVSARTVSKIANDFVRYIKTSRFTSYFNNQTGETLDSIDVRRLKRKNAIFAAKAGWGIPGSLNYLAGLYRGQAIARSGKVFDFSRKRNLLEESWAAFDSKNPAYDKTLEKLMDKQLSESVEKF